MYNFIFWFFYKYFEWKDKDDSTLIPSAIVFIVIIIHFGLLYSAIKLFAGWDFSLGGEFSYGQRKYMLLPIALLAFFLTWYFYYRKKAQAILKKYENRPPFSLKNFTLLILMIVIPLVLSIKLTNLAFNN